MKLMRRQNTKKFIFFFLILFICSGFVSHRSVTTKQDVADTRRANEAANDHLDMNHKADIAIAEVAHLAQGPVPEDDPELVGLLRRNYLHPPSQLPYNLKEQQPHELAYTMYKNQYPSWPFIDSILKDLFSGQSPGFFVEAGALDGEYLSNTLRLEVHQNWTGLLVEADGKSYDILREKKRKAWSSPACISTKSYPETVVLSSFIKQGKTAAWIERGAARIEKDPEFSEDGPGYKTFQNVQCFPSLTFFLALNVSKVDFFSLDVEGVEMGILKAFPFDKVVVDVWVIEHIGRAKNDSRLPKSESLNGRSWMYEDPEFVAFMEARGYYLFDMFCNPIPDYVFVRRESEIFNRLGVPRRLWIRRGLCFHKPTWNSEKNIFRLELHRDKRHWPKLRYSGD